VCVREREDADEKGVGELREKESEKERARKRERERERERERKRWWANAKTYLFCKQMLQITSLGDLCIHVYVHLCTHVYVANAKTNPFRKQMDGCKVLDLGIYVYMYMYIYVYMYMWQMLRQIHFVNKWMAVRY